MPHRDRIQESFGHHDIGDARASVGGAGGDAATQMGARAFTVGDRVAFGEQPDLRTAAHEAAHVVQQSRGVDSRAGQRGDRYERHADAVADTVVAGGSAEALLDQHAGGPTRKAVQKDPLIRGSDDDGVTLFQLGVPFRDAGVFLSLHVDDDTLSRFDADPALEAQLVTALTELFSPRGRPLLETTTYLGGPGVTAMIERALPVWSIMPTAGFPTVSFLLDWRSEFLRQQKHRVALEEYLEVDPGTVDWQTALPSVRSDVFMMGGTSMRENAERDRVETFLLLLENEVASAPPVDGGVVPDDLAVSIWDYVMSRSFGTETNQVLSEKFLGNYVDSAADLVFVPRSFDLERYRPKGVDRAAEQRHEKIDAWIGWAGPQLTTGWVLDDWTRSRLDFQVYIDNLDLDSKRAQILDYISAEYMKEARKDPDMMRNIARNADEKATFAILQKLATAGKDAERRNRDLVAKIDDPEATSEPELAALIANPRGFYESSFYVAQALRTIFDTVNSGGRVDEALVANAVAISGKATLPPQLGFLTALLTIGTELLALKTELETQRDAAKKEIAERVDLSWENIRDIVEARGEEAAWFLDNTWVPMLKEVALEWVTKNYDEIKDFHDNFETRIPETAGRYRIAAWLIENAADQIESGEIKSSTVNGHIVTLEDLPDLRNAVKVMRAKADELESPAGRSKKKSELADAIEAFARVKSNIVDGTYSPHSYGEDVVVEAKHRLGIGVFEYSSLWQQATRQVVVRENPFQAYAIAVWRVEHIVDQIASSLVGMFLKGLLTVGALLVPGVGGLILAGIDIGIGLYGSAKHIGEAERRLDLARLDTQLNIQGITVAQAEHALKMAWVSFVIEAVLAGVFTVLTGAAAIKGLKDWRFPNLAALAKADPILAAKLLDRMGGNLKLADALVAKLGGNTATLLEVLAYAKNGETLVKLISEVKDADLLLDLLVGTGHGAASAEKLVELLGQFKNAGKLAELLGVARPGQLLKMRALADEAILTKLLLETQNAPRVLKLLEAGLAGEEALALTRMGEEAVLAFQKLAKLGDAELMAAMRKLLGNTSHAVGAETLQRTAAFFDKYAGRVSGDFISRFESVVEAEAKLAKLAAKGGKEKIAKATAELDQANAELSTAVDVLEGRSPLGSDRSLHGLTAGEVQGVKTPEFLVTGGRQPKVPVEVKALGNAEGTIGKDAIQRNLRKAASQISARADATTAPGYIRLDASATGRIARSNEQIANEVQGQLKQSLKGARSDHVGWVEVLDKNAAGESQRLLLKVDRGAVTIDATGTTRVYP